MDISVRFEKGILSLLRQNMHKGLTEKEIKSYSNERYYSEISNILNRLERLGYINAPNPNTMRYFLKQRGEYRLEHLNNMFFMDKQTTYIEKQTFFNSVLAIATTIYAITSLIMVISIIAKEYGTSSDIVKIIYIVLIVALLIPAILIVRVSFKFKPEDLGLSTGE